VLLTKDPFATLPGNAELRLNRSRASFDASAIVGTLPAIFSRPVSKLMHNGQLWYVKGPDPTVLDAVKDMVLRGQVWTSKKCFLSLLLPLQRLGISMLSPLRNRNLYHSFIHSIP
jgi:hypothetical protein